MVRPKDGVQHPDLDKAWADYDAAVATATESIKAAINKQFDAATAKGDLDAAEKWQAALEKFEKAGEVPVASHVKPAVNDAMADCKTARNELTKAYESLVKTLTSERKLLEAKTVRAERDSLGAHSGPPLKWVTKTIRGKWVVDGGRITTGVEKWPEMLIGVPAQPRTDSGFEFSFSIALSNTDWGQRMQVELLGGKKAELLLGGKKHGAKPMDDLLAGRAVQPPCFLTPQKRYAIRCLVRDDQLATWVDGKLYCVTPMAENADAGAKDQKIPLVRLNFSWSAADIQDFTVRALSSRGDQP